MALTYLQGRQVGHDPRKGRRHVREYAISTAATDMPAPVVGTPAFFQNAPGSADTGATGRVFISGQMDEDQFPGLYFYVLDYEGVIGRTA